MPIITLTTDYGARDFYAGALKGSIISENLQSTIIDISHSIKAFDVIEGAFVLQNAYKHFPEKSIHILLIDVLNSQNHLICFEKDNHFFIMPDNGMVGICFYENTPDVVYKIKMSEEDVVGLNIHKVLAQIVKEISENNLTSIGNASSEYLKLMTMQPVYTAHTIHGQVIYIDAYRNVVLNVTQNLFERIRKNRNFEIVLARTSISTLSKTYSDVPENEICCLFNDGGWLEISINKSKAADLLGITLDTNILIDFM